jgi:predicted molibdopterin-dependent oxidoreductase YjgC
VPAAADWCEAEGTVTSVGTPGAAGAAALDPPGEARTDIEIISTSPEALGRDWGRRPPRKVWDELRSLSPAARRA